MKSAPIVLIFSGWDGTGGAGAMLDGRAVAMAGGAPLAVITALTAQNLDGVQHCWNTPPQRVRAQFAALREAPVRAVKIGVLGLAGAAVAECVDSLGGAIPVIWDPVFAPTGGAPFANAAQIRRLKKQILPRALIITPNRKELAELAELPETPKLTGSQKAAEGARRLRAEGARFILAKDITPGKEVRHELYGEDGRVIWRAKCMRRRGEYHGGGCFFSAVLAARLACGDSPAAAAATAQTKTLAAVVRATKIPQLGRQKLLG